MNSPASSPVSSSSRVTSINAGNPPNAEGEGNFSVDRVQLRGDETPHKSNWDMSVRTLESKTNSRAKR